LISSQSWAAGVDFKGYRFEAYVLKSSGRVYKEFLENNRSVLKVRPNEEYTIVVRNPLPVRVGVAVSIDGLNSIDGRRTSTRDARKWIIEPNGSVTIKGWQTSKQTLRKFVFTADEASLAKWREDKTGKAFTKNIGVIGVAWFWNQQELETALRPPQPFAEEYSKSSDSDMPSKAASRAERAAPAAAPRAATGMGKEQRNAVVQVAFDPTAGMFLVKDVLKIYYEFAQDSPEPLPFVSEDEDDDRFTPDMYK
jgi:hypothetical protein